MHNPDPTESPAPPPASREELVEMVAKAHRAGAYGESTQAGKALAAQSKLPKVIAENLGAGFGQWAFFPEATEIVDFALGYVPPVSEEDVWAMARAWASDDAAARPTVLALVGREIVQHELKRIEVPSLRELFDEWRPAKVLALRTALGLDVPAAGAAKTASKRKAAPASAAAKPVAAPVVKREIPEKMPKPARVPPKKAAPGPPAKRFEHPKFGTGLLEKQDGVGPEAKLTIAFEGGSKTLLARYVTEVTS